MKILSNYKDYYDYLQGIYGVDEKIVYERLCQQQRLINDSEWKNITLFKIEHIEEQFKDTNSVIKYLISICGVNHLIFYYKGIYYYGNDEAEVLVDNNYDNFNRQDQRTMWRYGSKYRTGWWGRHRDDREHLTKTDINDKFKCPVILQYSGTYIKNIRLSDFNINKYITAHDMYLMISNFLSKETPVEDKMTNVEKIESHGFDKITSFRNM